MIALRRSGLAVGAAITAFFMGISLIAQFWTPYDPSALSIMDKLQPPGRHHWFGTDQLGRDVLSMIMAGAQNSVGVALLSVVIGLCIGVPLGLLAAARRGPVDEVIMRGNDLIFAFPSLLLAILITAVSGPGAVNASIAIGIFNIAVFARVTRGGALQLWTRDYTLAARVAGKGPVSISRHPIFIGDHRRGRALVCGLGCPAAHPELGAHVERGADADGTGPDAGAVSRPGHLAVRAGSEFAGRRIAPAAGAGVTHLEPLLQIDALRVSMGTARILNDVSFDIQAGEILGLVGASGSGKSMTALAVMGLLPPHATTAGAVRLQGRNLTGMGAAELRAVRGRDIGMVFQEPMTALNPLMRIVDQVAETVRLHRRVTRAAAARSARAMLERVGLPGADGVLDRLPHELSGGQRQRVAIAMAVVLEPPLLIADEPTTALDVNTQAQVLRLLHDLARARRMGLLLVTHDLAVVARVTDRVAVLHQGGLVEQGATAQLLRHMRHPYGRALLAAAELHHKRGPRRHAGTAPLLLEACDIVHEYPRRRRSLWHAAPPLRAVDGVSLEVRRGETVGLIGESGSGKSSLLRILLALEQPRSGAVRLCGEVFSAARGAAPRRLRRSIQAVFQDPYGSFDPRWTVERLIGEPFHLLDAPPAAAERRRRVAAVLEQVGLAPADALRHPGEFSGGERQRIAIARALVTEPSVIAFDEAVSALDVLVRAQILELLASLSERLRLACLFVSHDLSVVRSIADRVYVMQHGRIVEQGMTEEVFGAPSHAYTRSLIDAIPTLG
jgi:peptide/nickel transport system ATP-binding protein